jgi:hypothetical protein
MRLHQADHFTIQFFSLGRIGDEKFIHDSAAQNSLCVAVVRRLSKLGSDMVGKIVVGAYSLLV